MPVPLDPSFRDHLSRNDDNPLGLGDERVTLSRTPTRTCARNPPTRLVWGEGSNPGILTKTSRTNFQRTLFIANAGAVILGAASFGRVGDCERLWLGDSHPNRTPVLPSEARRMVHPTPGPTPTVVGPLPRLVVFVHQLARIFSFFPERLACPSSSPRRVGSAAPASPSAARGSVNV